jgi:hypothetical protein
MARAAFTRRRTAARKLPPLFVLPGRNPGLLVPGNININDRPPVKYQGGIATVRSISFGVEWRGRRAEVLVPTVVGGAVVSDRRALARFNASGQFLGLFDTPQHASMYAEKLHQYHARLYHANR